MGRFTISGFSEVSETGTCDGTVHGWALTLTPDNGSFRGGQTVSVIISLACIDNGDYCSGTELEQTVKLRGGPGRRA